MNTFLRVLPLFAVALWARPASAQLLVYSFTGGSTNPTSMDVNLSASAFTGNLGSPATGSSSPTYSSGSGGGYFTASSWTGGSPGTNYFEFTITPASGYTITLSALSFGYRSTTSGPAAIAVRSSGDGHATDLATSSLTRSSTAWFDTGSLTLTSVSFSSPTTFRIYGSGATSASGTLRIDDVALYGSTSAVPEPSTYAAIAGGMSLAGVLWRRRKQKGANKPPAKTPALAP